MSTIKTFIFSLIFVLFLNNLSTACDFLGVNIGGNKSEIENYFGPIDDLDGEIVDAENTDKETDDADETTLTAAEPTQDNVITIPNSSMTLLTTATHANKSNHIVRIIALS